MPTEPAISNQIYLMGIVIRMSSELNSKQAASADPPPITNTEPAKKPTVTTAFKIYGFPVVVKNVSVQIYDYASRLIMRLALP